MQDSLIPFLFGDRHQLISTLDTDKDAGVAILISKKWHPSIRQIHRVSDRVMAVDCMIGEKLTRLISIYFPHSSKPGAAQLLDDCYHHLYSLFDAGLTTGMAILIGGDFNSTLDCSSREMRLRSLIDGYGLQISNEAITLDASDAWTYEHPLHGRHQIDHIFASYALLIVDGKAVNDLDMGSDHRAVRMKMHVKWKLQSPRKRKRKRVKRGWKPSDENHVELDNKLASKTISSVADLGDVMLDAAQMSTPQSCLGAFVNMAACRSKSVGG